MSDWAIGPFTKDEDMTLLKEKAWADTTNTNWKSIALFNPSEIAEADRLYLIYRAMPKIKRGGSLDSRLALAWTDDGVNWHDYENNPIIYPTESWEQRGCEDPKLYKYNNMYYLFYNTVWDKPEQMKVSTDYNKVPPLSEDICVDICLATSKDLRNWEKYGPIVPQSISKGWAKGAVIPRNPQGEAVKIEGKFMMYVSEGCGGQQYIGYSDDLIHWEFKPETYLKTDADIKKIHEVASAKTDLAPGCDDIILDFLYVKPDGSNGCGQVLYSKKDPKKRLAFSPEGLCDWGGIVRYKGKWLFAKGWMPSEENEPTKEVVYFYTAHLRSLRK
jgi:predicted GH43/DUF377 family glycosyl hydrolase